MRIRLTVLSIFLWLCPAALGEAKWIRMRSANFEIFSSAGEGDTRGTIRHFEQVRGFFMDVVTGLRPAPLPVRIVLFGSKKEYEPYRLNEFAAAYYLGGGDRDYIVMGAAAAQDFPVAVHEYFHLVVRHAGMQFPPWLNEGLAELYSTLKPLGGKILVGELITGRHQALFREKWVPLEILLAADRDSPYYNEKDKAGSLYNQGWALTHMLALHDDYRPQFAKVLDAIHRGTPSAQALTGVYGKPLAAIEKEVQRYFRGDRFQGVLLPLKLEKVREELQPEAVSSFDVKLVQAELLNRPERMADARKILEELAAEDPKRPEPPALLGYLAWRTSGAEAAVDYFRKAFAAGNRNPKFLWDFGRMAAARDPDAAISALRELVSVQPERLDAKLELASVLLRKRKAAAALDTLASVKKVEKADAPRLFAILAYANLEAGVPDEALKAAERWVQFASDPEDKQNAERILDHLKRPAAVRRPEVPAPAAPEQPVAGVPRIRRQEIRTTEEIPQPPPPRPSMAGSFVQLECLGAKAKLVLETESGRKTFLIEDPATIALSGTGNASMDLSCGPPKPRRVRVEFEPPSQGSPGVDGLLRLIDFGGM